MTLVKRKIEVTEILVPVIKSTFEGLIFSLQNISPQNSFLALAPIMKTLYGTTTTGFHCIAHDSQGLIR